MWAGVPPKRQAEAVERMLAQAAGARKGLLPEEFSRAKNFVVGELTMACETSEDMAHWLLWGDLAHRRLIPPGAVRATYEQLTPADIERAAALWAPERVQIAIAGPAPRRGARLVKLVQAQSASVSDPSASVAPVAHAVQPRSRRA
jgi:predicted Zn-dependent peptidase